MVSLSAFTALLAAVVPLVAAHPSHPWKYNITNGPPHRNHTHQPWRCNSTDKAPHHWNSSDYTPNKYIITLSPNATDLQQHMHWVKKHVNARNLQSGNSSLTDIAGVKKIFEVNNFRAYSGLFDANTLAEIKSRPEVLLVEPDVKMHMAHTLVSQSSSKRGLVAQHNPPWHLKAISRKPPVGSDDYVFDGNALGQDTFAYVIDSGIYEAHQDFEGRAKNWYNALDSTGLPFTDDFGSGTFLAGLIAGHTYGVAKHANLVGVKVFENEGDSIDSSILMDGFQWALNDIITNNRQGSAVINLSFGGPRLDSWDLLIKSAYDSGVLTVVAAGNNNTDVSGFSPASTPEALTVAAMNEDYTRSEFSNYGAGVDLFAPGKDLTSAWIDKPDSTQSGLQGTGFSAAIVSGLACYYRSLHGPNVAGNVIFNMLQRTINDAVKDPQGSPNKLAYNDSGA